MSSKESSNLIWIVAIVILLTFLIVVISWMSSGKLKVEKTESKAPITESEAVKESFKPEVPLEKKEIPPETPKSIDKEKPVEESKVEPEKVEKEKANEIKKEEIVESVPVIEEKKEEPKKESVTSTGYALQVGAFSSLENAKTFESKLNAKGYKTALKDKGNLKLVLIVGLKTQDEAKTLKDKLSKEKIDSSIITYP
jgi:cell division protein FtsN